MKKLTVLLIFILLASSCAPVPTAAPPTESPTATIIHTSTNTPTPQPTFTPTLTPTPKLPVLAGTPFPHSQSVISQENVDHLTNIARWGTGEFIDATYTKDMQKIVVVTASSITYYDTEQGIVIWSKESPVFKAELSNNGEFLAVVTSSGIELWDANNGLMLRRLEGVKGSVCPTGCFNRRLRVGELSIRQLDFSPDSKYLGAQVTEGTGDSKLFFWNLLSGDIIPASSGEYFGFSPDSSLVAISVDENTIDIHNTINWEKLFTLNAPEGGRYALPPENLIFSPDNFLFTAGQFDASQLFVWSMTNGEVIIKIDISSYRFINFISTNEIQIADGFGNRLIDINTGKQTNLLGEFRFSFGSYKAYDRVLGFSEDKEVIAIGILDIEKSTVFDRLNYIKEVQIWNINRNEIIQTIPLEGRFPECQFSDGKDFLSCISSEKFVKWNVKTGQAMKEISFGISLAGNGISFSSDSTMLQAGNDIVEINSGKTLFSSSDCCIGFSSTNIPIKLDETSDSINIINAQTGEILSTLETSPKGAIYHLSPDGSYLGIERNGIIQFWQVSDGKLLSAIGGGGENLVLGYSPDGKLIASGYPTNRIDKGVSVTLQDVYGKLITKLSNVLLYDSIAFSYDNKLIAVSGYEETSIFSIPNGQLIVTINTSLPCESMAFSINNDLLFCGLETGIIQILSVSEMNLISQIPAHSNSVTSLWLSPDGTLLGSGSLDGTTKLWAIWL